jgi:conjugative transfer signal peptidase TraF
VIRLAICAVASLAVLGAGLSALHPPAPLLIWNASASVPIGLYAVHPAGLLQPGELVVVMPPDDLTDFLADRGFLPAGAPLLKRVLALPGQVACRYGRQITIDDAAVGEALERDHLGRPLPVWQGCHRIAEGEVFLMNIGRPDSLDSRYFGALPVATIVGRAEPLWTVEDR